MKADSDRIHFRGTSPEARLILACCSVLSEPERMEKIRTIIGQPLDWAYLVAAAGNSASIPQLYQTLSTLSDKRIPSETMHELRIFYQHNSVKNLMLIQELLRLHSLLENHGIECLTYKGPSLAVQYYGSPSARMFWDLDLLVRKKDLPAIRKIMTDQEYCAEKPPRRMTEEEFLESDCEDNFDSRDGRVHLEIHWDILPRHSSFNFDVESLWQNAVPMQLGGSTVKTLSPEDLLLVLCVHAGDKHQWTALRMIQDISQVIANAETFDWEIFIQRIRNLRRLQTVLLGLYLARNLLNAPVPARILDLAGRDKTIPDIAALACGRIFRDEHGLPGYAEWKHYRTNLFNGSSGQETTKPNFLRYCLSILQPEFHDREELPRVSARFSFLHYAARLKRLLILRRAGLIRRLR